MHSAQKAATILVLLILFIDQVHHGSALPRQRRRCTVVPCKGTSRSYWGSCSASTRGRQGSKTRSRSKMTYLCGTNTCPRNLQESRLCNFTTRKAVECQPWSEWGDCKKTSCQLSGIQTTTGKKTVFFCLLQTERCTKSQLPCFNGGKFKPNITGCVYVRRLRKVCCKMSPHLQGVYEWFP